MNATGYLRMGRFLALWLPLAAVAATAQWDPPQGQWGKTDPRDVRVMTYNIYDHICRNADKSETAKPWHALARLVAALRPDVLLLQEAGDNDGNGTPGGLDSVAQLERTLDLFLHGGIDPFLPGGPVGAYVQKYAPGYDLPFIFVSPLNDGYNRNVLLSRFPFGDLNGDGLATRGDISGILPDLYAPGGNGGIRGFLFVELDLPDLDYAGDLVVGGAHLKAGQTQSDKDERERAARNVAYYVDYLFNGGGTGVPDPRGKIMDNPPATRILDADTPVVLGGDWNEDELTNGRKGPAEWLVTAELLGGTDGTDRDRSDATYDASVEPYTGSRATQANGYKYDHLAWQDSIATLRRSFVFYSNSLAAAPAWLPPELAGYPPPYDASRTASDHRPVIADFVLPPPTWPKGDLNCDGRVDFGDINPFVLALSNPAGYQVLYPGCPLLNGDINSDGRFDFGDINPFVALLANPLR
ncbi:MAG: endonuclease/exonuclease/phosphatase family protein [Planctomycetota bacterium]